MQTARDIAPKYRRVREAIVQSIRDEPLKADGRLPSIRELMTLHQASSVTITRALDDLRNKGLIEHRWGKGIFLRETQTAVRNLAVSFDSIFKPTDPRILQILQGIAREVAQTDWHLQLYPLPMRSLFQGSNQCLLAALLQEKRIDGLIALSPHPPEDIARLQAMCVPTVSILNEYPDIGAGCVMPDVTSGAQQLIRHLVDQHGRRKIHLVVGPNYNHSARLVRSSTALAQSLIYELRRRDLRCPPSSVLRCDYSWQTVEPVLRQWLMSSQRPDAIVVADPYLADHAFLLARELGLEVPRDISIVSWGGGKHLPDSKVSSIVLPLEEIGAGAISMLQQIFAGEPAFTLRLPVQLVDADAAPSKEGMH